VIKFRRDLDVFDLDYAVLESVLFKSASSGELQAEVQTLPESCGVISGTRDTRFIESEGGIQCIGERSPKLSTTSCFSATIPHKHIQNSFVSPKLKKEITKHVSAIFERHSIMDLPFVHVEVDCKPFLDERGTTTYLPTFFVEQTISHISIIFQVPKIDPMSTAIFFLRNDDETCSAAEGQFISQTGQNFLFYYQFLEEVRSEEATMDYNGHNNVLVIKKEKIGLWKLLVKP